MVYFDEAKKKNIILVVLHVFVHFPFFLFNRRNKLNTDSISAEEYPT